MRATARLVPAGLGPTGARVRVTTGGDSANPAYKASKDIIDLGPAGGRLVGFSSAHTDSDTTKMAGRSLAVGAGGPVVLAMKDGPGSGKVRSGSLRGDKHAA